MFSKSVFTIITLLGWVHSTLSTALPDYISACNRSDPRLDECMVEQGNEAIPNILKGVPTFNIPNLLPLMVPEIYISSKDSLNMRFKKCELHGLNTSTLTGMHVDFEKRKATLDVHIAHLTVLAEYNISGRIMILPIVGQGPANITIANGRYKYEFTYDLVPRRSGKHHVKFVSNNLEFVAERIYFKLDNLFNGDRMLGETMNRFLDENWKDVTEELYPSLKEAVGAIVTSIARGLFSKVPFDDMFLS